MGGTGVRGGGMGLNAGTTPSIMGMMVLSRNLFYLCGDPDSWDKRSLISGMMSKMDTGGRVGGVVRGEVGGMGGRDAFCPIDRITLRAAEPRANQKPADAARSAHSARPPAGHEIA